MYSGDGLLQSRAQGTVTSFLWDSLRHRRAPAAAGRRPHRLWPRPAVQHAGRRHHPSARARRRQERARRGRRHGFGQRVVALPRLRRDRAELGAVHALDPRLRGAAARPLCPVLHAGALVRLGEWEVSLEGSRNWRRHASDVREFFRVRACKSSSTSGSIRCVRRVRASRG